MRRLLLIVLLLLTTRSFAEDIIVTTNGDVTAGVTRNHRRSTAGYGTGGSTITTWVIIGEDSTSSTSHKLYMYYTGDDGNTWIQKLTRPFTATGGFTSSELDPSLTLFRSDTFWAVAPTVYSGANMQVRSVLGVSVASLDTIAPANSSMVTGLMRWKGDTLIYAAGYIEGEDPAIHVVKSNGAWSQSVTWTAIDSGAVGINSNDVDYDYCGSGVAIWDRIGLDLYWIDGTVNDAIKTLGTNKVPALLSTTPKNATTMAVYRDSLICVIAHLARDSSVWRYRWYATGGTRKTGLTLIDSVKIMPKNYYSGGTSDSMSAMPCLSGTIEGDTAVLNIRYWMNPTNADSIVIGRSLAIDAGFDSNNIVRNTSSYGEGKRYRGLCAPRYIGQNSIIFWQKGVSTPDSIWCAINEKETYVIEELSQNKQALGGRWLYFGGVNNNTASPDSGILEDTHMSGLNTTTNYATNDSLQLTLSGSGTTTRATLWRPLLKGRVPMPARPVWSEWEGKYIFNPDSATGSTVQVRFYPCWRPARLTQITNVNYRTIPSTTAWTSSQARSTSGTAVFSTTGTNPDFSSTGFLSTTPYTQGTTHNNNTAGYNSGSTLILPLNSNLSFWARTMSGELADSIGWIKVAKGTAGATGTTAFYSVNHATTANRPIFRILVVHAEHKWAYSKWMKNARTRYRSKATLYTPL